MTSNLPSQISNNPQAALDWLMRLPELPPEKQPSADKLEVVVSGVLRPCEPGPRLAMIAALLSAYFERQQPQEVREIEAQDWSAALAPYPQWVIRRACRWWKSEQNTDRRKRPVEGDIAALCRSYVNEVRDAQYASVRLMAPRKQAEPEVRQPKVSPDAVAKILSDRGFAMKRMQQC